MIERNDLLERAGVTPRQLVTLRQLRLIPAPTVKPTPGRGGKVSYYPDETLTLIEQIQVLQGQGMSLPQIAEHWRGSKVVVPTGGEFPGGVKEAEPSNPNDIAAMFRLKDRLKREFGAERILSIVFEVVEREGQEYVRAPLVVYR